MDSHSPIRSRTSFVGMTYRVVRMTETSNEIFVLSSKVMTGGLKLTIFTYKWGNV
jgi:hypothetical protein